jgi:DNA modification methylase
MLSKSPNYYFDVEAIKEKARVAFEGQISGCTRIRFGGHKYGDSDDPKHATKSGNEYIITGKRNRRSVWTVATRPFADAHFATFPLELVEPMVLASSRVGDVVLDPFMGSGTTAVAAKTHDRHYVGIDLNPDYVRMAEWRIAQNSAVSIGTETNANGCGDKNDATPP